MLFHHMLHHLVVPVGVDPQMPGEPKTVGKAAFKYTATTAGSDAMDGAIRGIADPLAFINFLICGIRPFEEEKHAANPVSVF